MDNNDILDSINNILKEMDKKSADMNTDLLSLLDSIEQLDFLISLESVFNVKISQPQLKDESLGKIEKLVGHIKNSQG
jgi:acyl carrier protein